MEAVAALNRKFTDLDLVIIESGGDNLAATFSPELSDLTLYVIDVAAGDKIPRKGGPGITKSDLLIINKIDLAPHVGASLEGHGSRRQEDARRKALRVHQLENGRRRRRCLRVHRARGLAGRLRATSMPDVCRRGPWVTDAERANPIERTEVF